MNAVCRHFPACGGCDFQDKTYAEQLAYKQTFCTNLFARFSCPESLPIIPSEAIQYYRNRMDFSAQEKNGSLALGLRQKNRPAQVIDARECLIFSEQTAEILDVFRAWAPEAGFKGYDVYRHDGEFRYVSIRQARASGAIMVTAVFAFDSDVFNRHKEKFQELAARLTKIAAVRSVYVCLNEKVSDDALSDRLFLLGGEEYLRENINGVEYLVGPQVFLQPNPAAAAKMYALIAEAARKSGGDVLDLYCGSGGIALQVAGSAQRVTGVDNLAANIELARKNAALNSAHNVEFVCADVEKYLLENRAGRFSLVIVDPPRAGLSKKTRQAIIESRVPNLVYVSCNPMNLREDLKVLAPAYSLSKIVPFDMFPHTRHFEVVAELSWQKPGGKE